MPGIECSIQEQRSSAESPSPVPDGRGVGVRAGAADAALPFVIPEEPPRPARICRSLLNATGASEGRRTRRKRNTAPDALGMAIKQSLLEAVIAADPDPDDFEDWLLAHAQTGAERALALLILDEWRFTLASPSFQTWLASGAPSEDARSDKPPNPTDAERSLGEQQQ